MSPQASAAKWVVRQIVGHRNPASQRASVPAPSPCKTRLRPGSTASAILEHLRANRRIWQRLGAIAAATGKHPKTVSWALAQLRAAGWLDVCGAGEPRVSSRYLRYRLRGGA